MKFAEETGAVVMPDYGAHRFTRVAGATPEAPDVYSPVLAGWVSPGKFQNAERPIWTPLAIETGAAYAKAAIYGEQIRAELAATNPALLMLDREFETQSVDPMFLEPESGLAWYDAGAKKPRARARRAVALRGRRRACRSCSATRRLRSSRRTFKPCSPIWAADSADATIRRSRSMSRWRRLFLPGRPVRLAHDRYQQFQGGIKRHAFKMRTRIGVDRATGKISAFAADHVLDGGGLANFSVTVANVGAVAAIGIYDIPKVDVTTVALHSRGVTAGSMRGYGTLQTMTALEVLIDEAAAALPLDPIEFRRRNALKTGGQTMTGNHIQRFGPHAGNPGQA